MAQLVGIKMNFCIRAMSLSVIAAAVLAACGGGDESSSPTEAKPTPLPTAALPGKVIDGYIEGATVCLDLNINQTCDASEPSATSKADGTYSLDITGLTTEKIKAAHLLTVVPFTAFDADDTVIGVKKTLAQAGKAAFSLMAPASAFVSADGTTIAPAVISPLTTMVSYDMIAGNGKPLAAAEAAVRLNMGMAIDTDLKQDFVANKNTALHNQAKVVAAVIGEVKKAAQLATGGISDRDALMAALSYLQQNVSALQTLLKDFTGEAMLTKLKEALTTNAFKPVPEDLISEARKITTSAAINMTALLTEGFYNLNIDSCGTATVNCSTVKYEKISSSGGQWLATGYKSTPTGWSQVTINSSAFTLTANGWVNNGVTGTYTADAQGGSTATETATGISFRVSSRMVKVDNKTAASISGLNLPSLAAYRAVTFAPGSKLYWTQTTPLADIYQLWTGYQIGLWRDSSETKLTSIDQLITAYQTANTPGDKLWLNGLNVTFDTAAANSLTGTVSLWSDGVSYCAPNGCSTTNTGMTPVIYTKTGSAPYEIKTISGQQILIIKANDPQKAGTNTIFSVQDGKLYKGSFVPVGAPHLSSPSFNKIGMDSILSGYSTLKVVN
jgi:hypothetical protein